MIRCSFLAVRLAAGVAAAVVGVALLMRPHPDAWALVALLAAALLLRLR